VNSVIYNASLQVPAAVSKLCHLDLRMTSQHVHLLSHMAPGIRRGEQKNSCNLWMHALHWYLCGIIAKNARNGNNDSSHPTRP
jgi:hypothetical protein